MNKSFQSRIKINLPLAGERIDNLLFRYIEQQKKDFKDLEIVFSRTRIQKFIHDGNIVVNNVLIKPSYITRENDIIEINIPLEFGTMMSNKPEHLYFDIIYNDRDLAVINKPAGMVVHPAHGHYYHTLLNGLLYLFPELIKNTNLFRTGIVHRLDKDTSGLLIITKNEITQYHIINQFKSRIIKKEYIAIVNGKIQQEKGEISTRIGRNPMNRKRMTVMITDGKESLTRYEVIRFLGNGTFIRLMPHTGRMHQLRVHMSHIKHPIIGDNLYARRKTNYHNLGLMLHARKIKFIHPRTNIAMEFETGLPDRFQIILQKGEV